MIRIKAPPDRFNTSEKMCNMLVLVVLGSQWFAVGDTIMARDNRENELYEDRIIMGEWSVSRFQLKIPENEFFNREVEQ